MTHTNIIYFNVQTPYQKTQMGIHFSPQQPQTFHILYFLLLLCLSPASSDNTDLIYRGCAKQNFPAPTQPYTQNLKTLFDTLIPQSSKTNFSKTTTGEGTENALFGLYQCRGDLSEEDCYNCVSLFPKLAKKYCGANSIAARVQLVGCYMRYEVVGFRQLASTDMLYKLCKGGNVNEAGFEGKRDSGFSEVESGVVSGGGGFYAASYESVYVMGQCEGDLVGSECGDCVKTALDRVKSECGNSMSGQVYLNQCYVSYSYYSHGVGGGDKASSSSSGTKQHTARTVAIVVGCTAAGGFVVAVLLVVKSAFKKKKPDQKYHYTYNG